MCNEIDQMARDLALKGYVQSTQDRYLKTARHLRARFGRAASVVIANSRLVDVTDEAVTFRTKNGKTTTVAPVAPQPPPEPRASGPLGQLALPLA